MNRIKCFLLEPTNLARVWLRVYESEWPNRNGTPFKCVDSNGQSHSYHNGMTLIGDFPVEDIVDVVGGQQYKSYRLANGMPSRADDLQWQNHTGWPTTCEHCGHDFNTSTNRVEKQVCEKRRLYKRADGQSDLFTPEDGLFTLEDAPVGAMWFSDWLPAHMAGPDGKTLFVMCPNDNQGGATSKREWMVDGRASNCTMPNDNTHRCWVRHGDAPVITVDKNGNTCQAGAGSIAMPGWHGFLVKGYLVENISDAYLP